MPTLDKRPKKEALKVGRKTLATILVYPDGRRVAQIARSLKDVYRGKNGYIAHAVEEGEAGWSVETLLLSKLFNREVELLSIKVRETGAVYLTRIDRFTKHGHGRNRRRRNGSMQKTLGLEYWLHKPGLAKL